MLRHFTPNHAGVVAGLAGALFGAALGAWVIVRNESLEPLVVKAAYQLNGVVHRDGRLDLVWTIDRVRDCASQSTRWLWTWVEQDGVRMKQFFPLVSSNAVVTGEGLNQRYVLSLPLPPGVWAGDWFYFARTVEYCPIFYRLKAQM
jgi:hypothetical protein